MNGFGVVLRVEWFELIRLSVGLAGCGQGGTGLTGQWRHLPRRLGLVNWPADRCPSAREVWEHMSDLVRCVCASFANSIGTALAGNNVKVTIRHSYFSSNCRSGDTVRLLGVPCRPSGSRHE